MWEDPGIVTLNKFLYEQSCSYFDSAKKCYMYINKESHILISTPHKPIYLGVFLKADLKGEKWVFLCRNETSLYYLG